MIVVLTLTAGFSVSAKHFELKRLPHYEKADFDLGFYANRISYYDFVRKIVGPELQKKSKNIGGENEQVLKKGGGVSVRINEHNYHVHINYPNSPRGGRSYGWTLGSVGDWSDAMYLDELEKVIYQKSEPELAEIYSLVIDLLGASNPERFSNLDIQTQLVINNFLAIYTAEAYRAMVPNGHDNWDEALLEVTLLSAFHSGQNTLTKFYAGKFTDSSLKQDSGVYNRGQPGILADEARPKKAQLRDYWQFSADPDSKRSGINLTRRDFEKMGQQITYYQRKIKGNSDVETIFALVGGDRKNVFKAIAQYFGEGKSQDVRIIPQLNEVVTRFLIDVRRDAQEMTEWQLAQP